jgi:hypothetical protein
MSGVVLLLPPLPSWHVICELLIDVYNAFKLYTRILAYFMDVHWNLAVFPYCLVLAKI